MSKTTIHEGVTPSDEAQAIALRFMEQRGKAQADVFVGETHLRDAEIRGAQQRSFTIVRADEEDAEDGSIEIAFASEEPYARAYGIEILHHDRASVKLERLNTGAAVLVNHESGDQVGVVVAGTARVDEDGRSRARIRFSRSQRGQEIEQDVRDGIRTLVSVGYQVHDYALVRMDDEPDTIIVTDWEPFEVSIVSIPADYKQAGVGRSAENLSIHEKEAITMDTPVETPEVTETRAESQRDNFNPEAERQKLRTAEKSRRDAIDAIADKHDLGELAREAISEDWTVADFNKRALEVVGERNQAARTESRHDGEVDLSNNDRQKFSLIRLMDAISNPNDRSAQTRAGFELEVSAEAQRGFGTDFNCRGEFVPTSLLEGRRDLSAGTATDGAELVANNLLASRYIEVLRNASSVTQAGMTVISGLIGTVDIPRQTSAASSTWISAEDGDATESEPQFDQISMAPKDLACYTEVTRRLLMQSTPDIEGIVQRDLAVAQALGIDLAALYGSGASGQPQGLLGATGVNKVVFAAADPTYLEIVQMIKEVMADNALMGNLSWIIEANGWEALSTTAKQGSGVEGNFILGDNDRIKGYGYRNSNQVTAEDYFFGNWSDLIMGEWGGLEMMVDPYTHSLKGKIRYVTFKTVDIAVRHPESFCVGNNTP